MNEINETCDPEAPPSPFWDPIVDPIEDWLDKTEDPVDSWLSPRTVPEDFYGGPGLERDRGLYDGGPGQGLFDGESADEGDDQGGDDRDDDDRKADDVRMGDIEK